LAQSIEIFLVVGFQDLAGLPFKEPVLEDGIARGHGLGLNEALRCATCRADGYS
jgi:hypothetical protein